MIKMIESKFESKAAKSTTKPCPHAAHLQMGCFHNCKRLRTQEDLFGLQTGNSPGKKCLISFSKEGLATAPKNEVGHRRCPWCRPVVTLPVVSYCTPATQAAPLKDWRTWEARETIPAGTFKNTDEQKKTMEAQKIPTVARGPFVEGTSRGCISDCIWSVKPPQLVGSGVLYGCFKIWSTALSWIRKFSFFICLGFF